MFPQNIGASIRTLRKQQNMSQRQLAEAIGVDPTLISHWESEKGKRCPSLDNLIVMSNIFGCSIEAVLGIETNTNIASSVQLDEYTPKEIIIIQRLLKEYKKIINDLNTERNV